MTTFGRPPVIGILAGAIAVIVALSASDTAHATFRPNLEITVTDAAPGASSDLSFEFGLSEGDVIFAGVVVFVPGAWGIVDGNDVPVGAEVGVIRAEPTLGLIGSACNQVLPVEFKMRNASLDKTDTVTFEDTDGSSTADFAEDRDGNGIIDGIDHWPEPISRILGETDADPLRRLAGMAIVASTPILLQLLVFEPGTFLNENIPNDPALGYPTITLLQNTGDPDIDPEPSAITDFCSPLGTTSTFFGVSQDNLETAAVDESGFTLFENPQDGAYAFTVVSSGLRDADGDGFENLLDTCPFQINIGNPRVANDGDLDSDGLDAVCDPNDNPSSGGTNSDQDGDGYLNRQDNCPLTVNGQDTTNQADEDLDQIGDICDPHPNDADTEGASPVSEVSVKVTIGGGVASPTPTPVDTGDDGSDTGLIVAVVLGIVAAIAVIGGGAVLMMRRTA